MVPEDEQKLYSRKTAEVADFAKRRELKINQFKKEKDLKARIEVRLSLILVVQHLKLLHCRRCVNAHANKQPPMSHALTLISSILCSHPRLHKHPKAKRN